MILFLVHSHHLNSTKAQNISWKKYSDLGQKFYFMYPPNWVLKSTHDNSSGTTNVILGNPNSSRAQVSILYNPNEALLTSPTGRQ